jgi:hypothetical protein
MMIRFSRLARLVAVSTVSAASVASGGVALAAADGVIVGRVNAATAKALTLSSLEPPAEGAITSPATCTRYKANTWLLPVWSAPGTSEVSCTVSHKAKLALNVGGIICFAGQETPAELEQVCKDGYSENRSLSSVVVDGEEIDEFAPTTGTFKETVQEPNRAGVPAGPHTIAYVGRSVLLGGLTAGAHNIQLLHRTQPGAERAADVDITYHVTLSGSGKDADRSGR